MQAIQSTVSYDSLLQVARTVPTPAKLPTIQVVDVYDPENLGLVISGPLKGRDFDYIREAYEQRLRLSDHPFLYLELHYRNRTFPQQIWDQLTDELKLMGDFPRIAIVRCASDSVETGEFNAPGVIIQQFSLAEAETAKYWLT